MKKITTKIKRKLRNRKKLKDVLNKLKIEKGMGAIIRTAGETMTLKEIKRDWSKS